MRNMVVWNPFTKSHAGGFRPARYHECPDETCRRRRWFTYIYTGRKYDRAVVEVQGMVVCASENKNLTSGFYPPDEKTVEKELEKYGSYTKGAPTDSGGTDKERQWSSPTRSIAAGLAWFATPPTSGSPSLNT